MNIVNTPCFTKSREPGTDSGSLHIFDTKVKFLQELRRSFEVVEYVSSNHHKLFLKRSDEIPIEKEHLLTLLLFSEKLSHPQLH